MTDDRMALIEQIQKSTDGSVSLRANLFDDAGLT